MFVPGTESIKVTMPSTSFSADVNTAEYFMADVYVTVPVITAPAGTLLST